MPRKHFLNIKRVYNPIYIQKYDYKSRDDKEVTTSYSTNSLKPSYLLLHLTYENILLLSNYYYNLNNYL